MSIDQSAEVATTPPQWLIPWITRLQVGVYEATRGVLGASANGMSLLLLRGLRRRSGKKFAVCLPYWLDESGHRMVVASFAGAVNNPAWYHNVKDTEANPEVRIRDGRRVFAARIEVLDGAEHARIWEQLVADRPFYGRYQEQTTRRIPLLRVIDITT